MSEDVTRYTRARCVAPGRRGYGWRSGSFSVKLQSYCLKIKIVFIASNPLSYMTRLFFKNITHFARKIVKFLLVVIKKVTGIHVNATNADRCNNAAVTLQHVISDFLIF